MGSTCSFTSSEKSIENACQIWSGRLFTNALFARFPFTGLTDMLLVCLPQLLNHWCWCCTIPVSMPAFSNALVGTHFLQTRRSFHLCSILCIPSKLLGPFLLQAQFLRLGLWPATVLQPRTAVTFQLLNFYHQLTLQSKVNLYDFYWSLTPLNSKTSDSLVPVCSLCTSFVSCSSLSFLQYWYKELSRCVCQFRHIMLIKCSSLAHSPLPLSSTTPGSCTVECPCCTHPSCNIPNNYLYVHPENKLVSVLQIFVHPHLQLILISLSAHFGCRWKLSPQAQGTWHSGQVSLRWPCIHCSKWYLQQVPKCSSGF